MQDVIELVLRGAFFLAGLAFFLIFFGIPAAFCLGLYLG